MDKYGDYTSFFSTEIGLYANKEISNNKMEILSFFLIRDAAYTPSSFKAWALDDQQTNLSCNLSILEKTNDVIIISNILSEEEDGGPFLEIPKEEFIKILNEWEKICKEKPKEVMIIKEDDTYRFETKN